MTLAAAITAPNPLMITPFVVMLLSIAFAPFIFKHHWHRFYHLVAVVLGSVSVFYYLFILKNGGRMLHVAHEYASFIALVGSLFVVAGGIHIRVKGGAKPWANCLFLLVGAVIANVIGTTGASMLMIRPWIRMNQPRVTGFHIVFFIFIVSNIGGCLTPIGDPPLFLGYLKGVPFWWVFEHCWKAWLFGVLGLTAVFYWIDRGNYRLAQSKITAQDAAPDAWKVSGLFNLIFLAIILVAIFINQPVGLRELLMTGAAIGSYFLTPGKVHKANHFTFEPIKEVAWLFLGIFATMVPALDYLEIHAKSLGIQGEMQFYWLTGLLSGLLDNAPTYLAFLATAFGLNGMSLDSSTDMAHFIVAHGDLLGAISLGAVFFGAMTYIGNGPNFMVKAISSQSGVETPEFVAYILKYALPILLPFLFVTGILFFSNWRIF
ncbi:MAG: sodium:proton antiporter [Verrucomicrobiota bacterium]